MKRRKFSPGFKAKVALEAIKGIKPINEVASIYQIHPNQVSRWKKQLLDFAPHIFDKGREFSIEEKDHKIQELYQNLGELQFELNWLKKKVGFND